MENSWLSIMEQKYNNSPVDLKESKFCSKFKKNHKHIFSINYLKLNLKINDDKNDYSSFIN